VDRPLVPGVTAIVPAFNEAATIIATVRSLQDQTRPPDVILVVDDCSTDGTGDLARSCGAEVVRTPRNSGNKGGALNFGIDHVATEFVLVVDADTVVARDGVALLVDAITRSEDIAGACGFVIPKHVSSVWERGRYVEYLFTLTFQKRVQDYYGSILVLSGCFSIYRTAILLGVGAWPVRTVAEDMDLTWQFHRHHYKVRYVPEAVCYPTEPHDFRMLRRQLRRWLHGFAQCLQVNFPALLRHRYLRTMTGLAVTEGLLLLSLHLLILPTLAIVLRNPFVLLAYAFDLPIIVLPVLLAAYRRKETGLALASIPSFLLMRTVNSFFLFEALWSELVLRRPLKVFEKGH
jgi:biofilm PGA synthesis N-glycosyltransferase PgaC